jgi:hypothetical protein
MVPLRKLPPGDPNTKLPFRKKVPGQPTAEEATGQGSTPDVGVPSAKDHRRADIRHSRRGLLIQRKPGESRKAPAYFLGLLRLLLA